MLKKWLEKRKQEKLEKTLNDFFDFKAWKLFPKSENRSMPAVNALKAYGKKAGEKYIEISKKYEKLFGKNSQYANAAKFLESKLVKHGVIQTEKTTVDNNVKVEAEKLFREKLKRWFIVPADEVKKNKDKQSLLKKMGRLFVVPANEVIAKNEYTAFERFFKVPQREERKFGKIIDSYLKDPEMHEVNPFKNHLKKYSRISKYKVIAHIHESIWKPYGGNKLLEELGEKVTGVKTVKAKTKEELRRKEIERMLKEASEEILFKAEVNAILDEYLLGQKTVRKLSILNKLQSKLEEKMTQTENEYFCKVGIIVEEKIKEIWASYEPKSHEEINPEDIESIPTDVKVSGIFNNFMKTA